jgi:polyhydroxybutyrate depolymerase
MDLASRQPGVTVAGLIVQARPRALVVLSLLALTGCGAMGRSSHTAGSGSRSAASVPAGKSMVGDRRIGSAGCDHPAGRAATVLRSVAVPPAGAEGRHERTYLVHMPPTRHGNQPIPAVLYFHGHGGSASQADANSGWSALADQHGFLAVYPQGLPFGSGGSPAWASAGPVDFGINEQVYTERLLNDLQSHWCVDPRRIYATGMSSGGGMTNYLGCYLARRIAALAPVAGNFYPPYVSCPDAHRPIPVLEIHGADDPVVPYRGGGAGDWVLPSIPAFLAAWARRDRCRGRAMQTRLTPTVTREAWDHCADRADVIHYRIAAAGHTWPPHIAGTPTDQLIWSFFAAHP